MKGLGRGGVQGPALCCSVVQATLLPPPYLPYLPDPRPRQPKRVATGRVVYFVVSVLHTVGAMLESMELRLQEVPSACSPSSADHSRSVARGPPKQVANLSASDTRGPRPTGRRALLPRPLGAAPALGSAGDLWGQDSVLR